MTKGERLNSHGGDLGRIIGDFSEGRVLEALSGLSEIQTVTMMEKGTSGLDMKVRLANNPHVDEVQIQVKSSARGIVQGKDKLRKSLGLVPEELHDWLLRNKFVFLNGARYRDQIQDDFLYYLRQIEEFNKGDIVTTETSKDDL